MPATFSHQIFSELVLKSLPKEIEKRIEHKQYFCFGAQGGDLFYIFRPIINLKNISYGVLLHRHYIYETFNSFYEYLKENENDTFAFSYVLGYLTHYAMDITFHPYVYYMDKMEREKALIKRRRRDKIHYLMESDFDVFLVEKYKGEEIGNYSFPLKKESIETDKIYQPLSNVFTNVYGKKFNIKTFKKCVRNYFAMNKLLIDRKNRKRKFIHFLEKLFFTSHRLSYLFRREKTNQLFLNLDNNDWNNIYDETIASSESVYELVEKAKTLCVELIQEFCENLLTGKILDYKKFSKNFNTGL